MRRKRGLEAAARAGGPPLEPVGTPMAYRSPAWAVGGEVIARFTGEGGAAVSGTGRRFVAWFTDIALFSVLWIVGLDLLERAVAWPSRDALGVPTVDAQVVLTIASSLVGALWFVIGWSGGRSTPGMWIWRIRVVDAISGGPVAIGAAVRRWVVLELPTAVAGLLATVSTSAGSPESVWISIGSVVWPILILLSVLRSPLHQGWHDRFGGTLVVRRARPAAAAA